MKTETYSRHPDGGSTPLTEVTELLRDAQGKARYRRQNPPGTVIEDREATPAEAQMLAEDERTTKQGEAKTKAIQAILSNKTGAPWGVILYDLAVGQGWIEP